MTTEINIAHDIGDIVWIIAKKNIEVSSLKVCPFCHEGYVIAPNLLKLVCPHCKGKYRAKSVIKYFVSGPFTIAASYITLRFYKDRDRTMEESYFVTTEDKELMKSMKGVDIYEDYFKTEQEALAKCSELQLQEDI